MKLVFATMIAPPTAGCRVSISDLECHQLTLLLSSASTVHQQTPTNATPTAGEAFQQDQPGHRFTGRGLTPGAAKASACAVTPGLRDDDGVGSLWVRAVQPIGKRVTTACQRALIKPAHEAPSGSQHFARLLRAGDRR
jgi:hypothetical protein